jgi:hypothetical protein
MINPEKTFALKAPWVMSKLREDFAPLTPTQAAGILGNLGHECGGFSKLAESGGHGPGRGWAQWSFDRRVRFEAYCNRHKLDWRSDRANYAWLFLELSGPYKRAITELRRTTTLKDAVRCFERVYEVAGVKNYASRNLWAKHALAVYENAQTAGVIPPHLPTIPPATKGEEHVETVLNLAKSKTLISLLAAFAAPYLARYGVTDAGTAQLAQDVLLGLAALSRVVASKDLRTGAPLAS